jgi:hypothetical protein
VGRRVDAGSPWMRVVHLVREEEAAVLQPVCGDWGAMDTDWTHDPAGVTCGACLAPPRDLPLPGDPEVARYPATAPRP